MSVKVPLPLLRYKAGKEDGPVLPGQFVEFTTKMSCQPSPSTSRNAAPEPIVSGRYLRPKAPLLWRKWIPAALVTSEKVTSAIPAAVAPEGAGRDDRPAVRCNPATASARPAM